MAALRCIIVPILLLSLITKAQVKSPGGKSLSTRAIDQVVTDLMEKAEVTGLSLGIINNNRPVYIQAYGFSNKPANLRLDTASCLYAASLAKPLFAYLVMQLADSGLIDLDRPLYTYLPKPLPKYDNYKDLANDERYKLITARHCLSHTTGFPNWRQYDNPHQNQKLEIFFTPGQYYAYSGEGIELLQLVVETVTGQQLETLAQQLIFTPFAMRRTSFLWQPDFEKNYAWGHNLNEDTLPKNKRTEAHAAGSMETTIADYTRFMAAVMQGKNLSAKSALAVTTPQVAITGSQWQLPPVADDTSGELKKIQLSYGLGWGLFTTAYGQAFFKEGHIDGWMHYTINFPGSGTGYVIMTNSSNGESIFKELVEKLTGVTIPWKWEHYIPYRPVAKLSTAALQAFTGEYDGRLKVFITLENGKLRVRSPTVNLPKTNFYPSSDHHLFLKIMDAEFEFVKGPDDQFDTIIAEDEGEHYELKRVRKMPALPARIDTAYAVQIGGIRQWISVKGQDRQNPVLLWICGGPGNSVLNNSDKFTRRLQEAFVVVQWDQREAGNTLRLNHSDEPLRLALFQEDTHRLIDSLRTQFHQQKIYLVGHSWGTAPGFYIAGKYPELLYAFIAISPMVNQIKSEQVALDLMKAAAVQTGNKKAAMELGRVSIPFSNAEDLYYDRRWLIPFDGVQLIAVNLPASFIRDWAATWLPVFNEAAAIDLTVSLPEINCPVYFFTGRKDYQTNHNLTEAYFKQVKAPKKQLYWFEKSGHLVPDTEPEKMQDTIIHKILPETYPVK